MRVAANRNMDQARLLVVVGYLLAIISVGEGNIEMGPSNTVVMIGPSSEAIFKCRAKTDEAGDVDIKWWKFPTQFESQQISDRGSVIDPPNAARYSIITDAPGQFDLRIAPVELTDAVYYLCQDANATEDDVLQRSGALLIVIDGKPNCTSTIISESVVEGENHTAECTVKFRAGNDDIAPVMTWSGPDPFGVELITSSGVVTSRITFTATRTMEGKAYTCVTNFTSSKGFDALESHCATNVPDWTHVWSTPLTFINSVAISSPSGNSCSDLTGHWQTTDHAATMDFSVDIAKDGVMTAMMKIEKTYAFVIYGRIQIDTWGTGSFAIFSPSTVGIDAYFLQCKACNGVDTLTASQFVRSESTCDQPGVSSIRVVHTFYRNTE